MRFLPLYSFLLLPFALSAQTIFPSLEGQELIDSLRANFRPQTVLTYGEARDTLWRNIDSDGNSLSGVYSGFSIELDPSLDPTQDAFAKGINAEHTYPRSRGAENGNPRSDMHHLFPTREQVNTDRGSLPFGEIPDNQTDDWYFMANEQTNPPANNRDAYSERLQTQRFEPREDHKGNVARAMFYFYTVYRAEVDATDPNYFPPQIADLCDWHELDPVDQRELDRSAAIALYQDGKDNPFIVDCDLVRRAYCPQLAVQSCISSTSTPNANTPPLFQLVGVQSSSSLRRIDLQINETVLLQVDWFDALGRQLAQEEWPHLQPGGFSLQANLQSTSGPLIARLQLQDRNGNWQYQSVILP
ncbi:MAG: endonuclease [Bacteroidota bacterium]